MPTRARFLPRAATLLLAALLPAQALADPALRLRDPLSAILRDEVAAWYAAAAAASAGGSATDADTLVASTETNTAAVLKRLKSVAAADGTSGAADTLIKAATASQNLCIMPPTWHPWL